MLIGTRKLGSVVESDEIYVGLIYLSPGATYPQHAHDATELYYTVLGSAMWGPTLRHLNTVKPGNFVLHAAAQPHTFKVRPIILYFHDRFLQFYIIYVIIALFLLQFIY